MDAHPTEPLITWAGASAEVVALRTACAHWSMPQLIECFNGRHLDLHAWTSRHAAFPIPELSLRAIGEHLGYAPSTDIAGGLDALVRFQVMLGMRSDAERTAARAELEAYNRDDLLILDLALSALETAR